MYSKKLLMLPLKCNLLCTQFSIKSGGSAKIDVGLLNYEGGFGGGKIRKKVSKLTISPNPTSDNLIIQSPAVIKDLVIYSIEGKIIESFRNLQVSTYDVDVSNFTNGIYRVEIITKDGNRLNKNFIKTN